MPFDPEIWLRPQNVFYEQALAEVRAGCKRSHWIWFIFPRLSGVGSRDPSPNHRKYDIKSLEQAREYLKDPTLRRRLVEISEALLQNEGDVKQIFDRFRGPHNRCDTEKVHSCMTLFMHACPSIDIFKKVIDKFYEGKPHRRTEELLLGDGSI